MPGTQFEYLQGEALKRHILQQAGLTYPWDARNIAVGAVVRLSAMQASPFNSATLNAAVSQLAGYLTVTMPTLPADLTAESEEDLRTLAAGLELAAWDWHRRVTALEYTFTYYSNASTPPSATDFKDTFLLAANFSRAARGLSALS